MKTLNEIKKLLNENKEAFWTMALTTKDEGYTHEAFIWMVDYLSNNVCPRITK